jgi:hypothetical protein
VDLLKTTVSVPDGIFPEVNTTVPPEAFPTPVTV